MKCHCIIINNNKNNISINSLERIRWKSRSRRTVAMTKLPQNSTSDWHVMLSITRMLVIRHDELLMTFRPPPCSLAVCYFTWPPLMICTSVLCPCFSFTPNGSFWPDSLYSLTAHCVGRKILKIISLSLSLGHIFVEMWNHNTLTVVECFCALWFLLTFSW